MHVEIVRIRRFVVWDEKHQKQQITYIIFLV